MDRERRQRQREAASGDLEASAQLVIARIRSGEIPRERAMLAARLGHEVARAALAEVAETSLGLVTPGVDRPTLLAWACDCVQRAVTEEDLRRVVEAVRDHAAGRESAEHLASLGRAISSGRHDRAARAVRLLSQPAGEEQLERVATDARRAVAGAAGDGAVGAAGRPWSGEDYSVYHEAWRRAWVDERMWQRRALAARLLEES